MKKSKYQRERKKYFFKKKLLFPILLSFSCLFLCIGYARINDVNLNISGLANAEAQKGLFITSVNSIDENNCDIENSYINSSYSTFLNSSIILENQDSSISYKVTLYNNSNLKYEFIGLKYDINNSYSYDNPNIVVNIDESLNDDNIIEPFNYMHFIINFKYSDNIEDFSKVDNTLTSILNFEFKRVEYFVTYTNINIDNYPETIASGDNLSVKFSKNYENLIIKQEGIKINNYAFVDNMLTIENVSSDLMITVEDIANEPILDKGMIPIVLNDDGSSIKVSKFDENWYDYNNKKWANSVLVIETSKYNKSLSNGTPCTGDNGYCSREDYLNGDEGITIPVEDTLAYFVWIPRYKYAIPSGTGARTIAIVFEDKYVDKSIGTGIDDSYITHPAFTFEKEVNGIWVGKFESTAGTEKNIGSSMVTILPDNVALTGKSTFGFFKLSLTLSGGIFENSKVIFNGNNVYGLTKNTDSHMLKNSEWGAVAYLSNSIYGIDNEIYINNSSKLYTGRSGGNVSGSVLSEQEQYPSKNDATTNLYSNFGYYTWNGKEIIYNETKGIYEIGNFSNDISLGTRASTTGNITGVYDMSGGADEYVMSYLYSDNIPFGGNSSTGGTNWSDFTMAPPLKYWDKYTMKTASPQINTLCNGGICYGHAYSETSKWYNENATFLITAHRWVTRGSSYSENKAGIFSYSRYHGDDTVKTFRITLITE